MPVRELVDEVWYGDEPPADAVAALQALVGRLRRALGRDRVASTEGGYRLDARPEDVDACRFERLAADGAAALTAGDAGRAAALLDEALGLWRGPALADLAGLGRRGRLLGGLPPRRPPRPARRRPGSSATRPPPSPS